METEARRMTEITGVEWRALRHEGVDSAYIISEKGDVYNFRRHVRHRMQCYGGRYVRLRFTSGEQHACKIDALLLETFPENYPDSGEEWRVIEIDGEGSAYEVSENGEIRRADNRRRVRPIVHKCGYLVIRLRHKGKTITEYAHRLTAKAFLPNPHGLSTVNHKDENPQNNAVSNLEWCDKSYNMLYHGASKRASRHAMMTVKLKRLANNGNTEALEILRHKRYYDSPELFQKAAALVCG
jgi:hypothetical protein